MYTPVPPLEAAIIGSGSQEFWNVFARFRVQGTELEEFAPTWNWSTFILGGFWYIYRKVYVWGGVILQLIPTAIPSIGSPIAVVVGIGNVVVANYLYYLYVRDKAKKIKAAVASDEKALRIAQYMGGVNIWAIWVAAPILLFFFV
jgi:hypothetical protein